MTPAHTDFARALKIPCVTARIGSRNRHGSPTAAGQGAFAGASKILSVFPTCSPPLEVCSCHGLGDWLKLFSHIEGNCQFSVPGDKLYKTATKMYGLQFKISAEGIIMQPRASALLVLDRGDAGQSPRAALAAFASPKGCHAGPNDSEG